MHLSPLSPEQVRERMTEGAIARFRYAGSPSATSVVEELPASTLDGDEGLSDLELSPVVVEDFDVAGSGREPLL